MNRIILCLFMVQFLQAQKLTSIVIAGAEAKNTELSNETIADIFTLEYKKLNLFDVYDKHDAIQITKQNQIELYTCFNKSCLSKVAKLLNVEKAISCQLERFNEKIYISIRQIDATTGEVDLNYSEEFLSLSKEIQSMCELTLRKMYKLPYDEQKMSQLSTIQTQESKLNNPEVNVLNLSGPRFGFTYISGNDGRSFERSSNEGGFDAFPIISQFGYQFELAYLNQGNIQGLFEFIPSIGGIEHGAFIPSIAILHGIRSNKSGFEFAVGPLLNISKRSVGYYSPETGKWIRLENYKNNTSSAINDLITTELDRGGKLKVEGGLVIAFGKSIRSGNVNFPINIFTILKKDSPRFGFSMGFNTKKMNK